MNTSSLRKTAISSSRRRLTIASSRRKTAISSSRRKLGGAGSIFLWIFCGVFTFTSCQNWNKSTVVFFENDVHCTLEKYAVFAGMRDAVRQADTAYVLTVSSGDFLSGSAYGSLSKGRYPVEIMHKIGYDAITLGNHEWDFGFEHGMELCKDFPLTCANLVYGPDFNNTGTTSRTNTGTTKAGERILPAYRMIQTGKRKIAFVGITTPQSIHTYAACFHDEKGNQLYDLCEDNFYQTIQESVNNARQEGADYVIALSHLGIIKGTHTDITSLSLINQTYGIDVVLDGHSHSLIRGEKHLNATGDTVLLCQSGYQLENFGKLVIGKDGKIACETYITDSLSIRSPQIQATLDSIQTSTQQRLSQKVGSSRFSLIGYTPQEKIVRRRECGLGNLACDALRTKSGAQIALLNGGGIRENLHAGEITKKHVIDAFPFFNKILVIQASGEQIQNYLEESVRLFPLESGGFVQVSGVKFFIGKSTPKIRNLQILDKDGKYKKCEAKKNYSVALSEFMYNKGDGNDNLFGCPVLREFLGHDNEIISAYIQQELGGSIPSRYQQAEGRIRY